MAPVWVVGCHGMLGRELTETLAACGVPFIGTDRECDITDMRAVDTRVREQQPGCIVNAAAYTAVDKAEDEPDLAFCLNAQGAENLAHAAQAHGARLIHLSTDYVFAGTATRPYTEEDAVAPLSVYGKTKAEGERRVVAACPEAVVLRTAWLYGKHGSNFVHTMLRLMGERARLTVVADQHGTPTCVTSLCRVIYELIARFPAASGIYHVTDGGETTWFGFASAIAEEGTRFGLVPGTCHLAPCVTSDYPTRACRPAYAVLSKDKISALRGTATIPWRDALAEYLRIRAVGHCGRLVSERETSC